MNLRYHLAVGIIGEVVVPSHGLFLLFSIAPDVPLIFNEIKLRREKRRFDPEAVSPEAFFMYHLCHSIFVTALLWSLSAPAGAAHLIHVVADWFTHTGRFAAMPFYPFWQYRIKFGREILK